MEMQTGSFDPVKEIYFSLTLVDVIVSNSMNNLNCNELGKSIPLINLLCLCQKSFKSRVKTFLLKTRATRLLNQLVSVHFGLKGTVFVSKATKCTQQCSSSCQEDIISSKGIYLFNFLCLCIRNYAFMLARAVFVCVYCPERPRKNSRVSNEVQRDSTSFICLCFALFVLRLLLIYQLSRFLTATRLFNSTDHPVICEVSQRL